MKKLTLAGVPNVLDTLDAGQTSLKIAAFNIRRVDKTGRLNRDDAVDIFASKLMGIPFADHFIPIPVPINFLIIHNPIGQTMICSVTDTIVKIMSSEYLMRTISDAVDFVLDHVERVKNYDAVQDFTFTAKQIDQISKTILLRSRPLLYKDIAMVKFLSEPGLCWHRLDFDAADAPTPTFDYFLSRIKSSISAAALQAFIGALFDNDAAPQNFCWLVGEGKDGKGTLFTFLRRLLGHAATEFPTNHHDIDKHWSATFLGKRLGLASEVVNHNIVHNSQFKSITGGDDTAIRQMYKDIVNEKLTAMLMLGSNVKPNIKRELSVWRRCILIEFDETPAKFIKDYAEKIWSERAGIIYRCLFQWQQQQQLHGEILVDAQALGALAEENEADFLNLAETLFDFQGKHERTRTTDVWRLLDYTLKGMGTSHVMQKSYCQFLKNTYGVTTLATKVKGERGTYFVGLRIIVGSVRTPLDTPF